MGIAQRALLGMRCLQTLLETAAVRDAAEDSRNELRIIIQD